MGKHILLVDDDPEFVEATKGVLEGCNYRVTTAFSVDQCFDRLEAEKPDLIILDVMMARLNSGFDVSRKLKKDPQTKEIPILMLTGVDVQYPFEFEEVAGDKAWLPVEDFVAKPVEAPELVRRIERLLK